jgi:hypothetical protein
MLTRNHVGAALFISAALLCAAPAYGALTSAQLQPNDQVCEDLDSGKIDAGGSETTLEITAPEGFLISGYCVKAGSAEQEEGPVFVVVDPPQETVIIEHPSGKEISHYSVEYVPITPPTTPPPTTPPPTTPPPTTPPPTTPPPTTPPATTPPATTPPATTPPPPTTPPVTKPPSTTPPAVVVPPSKPPTARGLAKSGFDATWLLIAGIGAAALGSIVIGEQFFARRRSSEK